MSTATKPRAWWQVAPNPACAPFCTVKHEPLDFTRGGSLLCCHMIATTADFEVEIQRMTDANDDDSSLVTSEVRVYFDVVARAEQLLEMTPEKARQLGMDLHMALSKAAHLAEEANRTA